MLTVVTPADSYRLTTLDAVKAELRLTGSGDDAFLGSLIDQASASVRTWCNRTFALETLRETLRLHGPAPTLMLSRWPIVSVSSITTGGQTIDASGIEVDAVSGFIYRAGDSIMWCAGSSIVEYQAGFVLPGSAGRTLPPDVERAAILLVRAAWFSRARDPAVKAEDVPGVASVTYWVPSSADSDGLPPEVERLLSPHRLPALG